MAKKSSLFIRQFVIGLGFLSGLFTAIGFDPQDEIIKAVGGSVSAIYPDPQVSSLFFILPTVLLLISVITAYLKGGILGLVSVVVAYFSGLSVLTSVTLALVLLVVAAGLGYLATNRRLARRIRP
jgi:hypothetical protein